MFATPQAEHAWLDRLVGQWKVKSECQMPDGSSATNDGTMVCRSVGGLWLVGEGTGEAPGQGSWASVLTLGYDPARNCYLGSFIASMMPHLWLYEGRVDESGSRLTLDTEGPNFSGDGMARYQDIIEIVSDDLWTMTSHLSDEAGNWQQINRAEHHRVS